MSSESALNKGTPYLLSIVRVVIGFLVLWHGMLKTFGYPTANAHVPLMSMLGIAGLIELAGGALIILGLLTRPVAVVLTLEMAVMYLTQNLPKGYLTLRNGGEPAAFYTFFFLVLAAAGAGAWSVDRLISRKSAGRSTYFASGAPAIALGLMRIAMAAMFIQHGSEKFLGLPGGRPDYTFTAGIRAWGGLMEFFLSPLLAVGLFTRPIAFLLSGEMATAYWTRWARLGFWQSIARGEPAIYFCFMFLLLFLTGSGGLALDNVFEIKRRKKSVSEPVMETVSATGAYQPARQEQ